MRSWALVLCAVVTLGGCASYSLMPTPVLYAGAHGRTLFTSVDADGTVPIDLLYVTDRAPAAGPDVFPPYTAERSRQLSFGSTTVEFGSGITWRSLVAQSTASHRGVAIELSLDKRRNSDAFRAFPTR